MISARNLLCAALVTEYTEGWNTWYSMSSASPREIENERIAGEYHLRSTYSNRESHP
jgi:hypothetical protein